MAQLAPSDRAELVNRLKSSQPGDYDKITDSFLEELGKRTTGQPVPTAGATHTPTAPPAAPAPPPTTTPTGQATGISPDVSYLARTMFGEGEGEGLEGQRAIAHVIANRLSKKAGKSVQQIVQAPNQFESWADGNPRKPVMEGLDLNDPKQAQLVALAKAVLGGQDPDNTEGSSLFFNPDKVNPGWAARAKPTVKIGQHQFLTE